MVRITTDDAKANEQFRTYFVDWYMHRVYDELNGPLLLGDLQRPVQPCQLGLLWTMPVKHSPESSNEPVPGDWEVLFSGRGHDLGADAITGQQDDARSHGGGSYGTCLECRIASSACCGSR